MNKAIFWLGIFTILVILASKISSILPPFIIALILAYILAPLISLISSKYHAKRTFIVLGIFAFFFVTVSASLIIILPILYDQISSFIYKIPIYKAQLKNDLVPFVTEKISSIDPFIAGKMQELMLTTINSSFSLIMELWSNIWEYTKTTINIVIIMLLVPIVLIYLLKDWHKILACMDTLLPLKEKSKIREILSSINVLLSAYMRGQLNVCLLLCLFYSSGLLLIGVDFSIILGILSGLLIILPFIGIVISFLTSMIVGYFTFGLTSKLLYIVTLYICGILFEGYFLTPKIIGDKIGLHPLWIMFAVFACGSLFGLVGVFFAIPIAGIIKVLLYHAIVLYKNSTIYKS